MRSWTIAILPLALSLTATGCSGHDGDKRRDGETTRSADAGPKASRNFALSGFTGIKVTGPDDVEIRRGDAFAISAVGPQDELEDLEIELDGSTLSIGRKREGFSFNRRKHAPVRISITMPRLGAVRLTGSGSIDADAIEGDAVETLLTGSGDLKVATLSGKSAKIDISGSGDIEIGAGTIGSGDVSVTGSGDVDASGLTAESLEVSVTGSGNVAAQATATANIRILGSGDVNLTGGAACTTKTLGSGSATCK